MKAYKEWLERANNLNTYMHVREFWQTAYLKYKCSNPVAHWYQFLGKAAKEKKNGENKLQEIFENYANAMKGG